MGLTCQAYRVSYDLSQHGDSKQEDKVAKALIVRTDLTHEVVEFEVGNSYNLIREAVGGWIECAHIAPYGVDVWLHEEGKLIGLPHNLVGTRLWEAAYGRTDAIVGDIVVTGGADEDGETLGLTDEQLNDIKTRLMYDLVK